MPRDSNAMPVISIFVFISSDENKNKESQFFFRMKTCPVVIPVEIPVTEKMEKAKIPSNSTYLRKYRSKRPVTQPIHLTLQPKPPGCLRNPLVQAYHIRQTTSHLHLPNHHRHPRPLPILILPLLYLPWFTKLLKV